MKSEGFSVRFIELTGYMNYFLKRKSMNRVHGPHGPDAGRRCMVHGGPWTVAWSELTGVRAHRRYSDLELTAATPK
jgi:hypothetical protein